MSTNTFNPRKITTGRGWHIGAIGGIDLAELVQNEQLADAYSIDAPERVAAGSVRRSPMFEDATLTTAAR